MTVSLKHVSFSYPGAQEKQVLRIPDWSVKPSESLFIYGPSGGGKTTLLNLISGILAPTSGEITVLGERLDQMNLRQRDQFRANHIGYVFQQFNLIPYLNAVENIQLAARFSRQRRNTLLRSEIEALLTRLNLPAAEWQKSAANLSIGQQQRVAIARAMINKPQLLIADEPTSSLDQHNRSLFMSELMALVSENSISLILVSHDMSLSDSFSRVESLSDISSIQGAA